MAFAFADCVLDVEQHELRRSGELVALEPQVFDLLVHLIGHRSRIVSKAELIDKIWGGRIISDSAVTTRLNAARKAIGDTGAAQHLIRTVSRRGVRFVAEVWEQTPPASTESARAPVDAAAVSMTDGPSIAVLPFADLGAGAEQEYFADGITEEIITALSRIRWLRVMARNSTLAYKGNGVDVKQVGRELGVRYVLEGSVRRESRRLRVTAQLIDAATGAHVWAERFDGTLDDVFEFQDKVASSVAGVIEPELQAAETSRVARRPTADLAAYDLYLRAYAAVWSSARRIHEALRLTEQAIARDPQYGLALAWAAYCCFRLVHDNRSHDPAADRAKGVDFARRALEVGGDDPAILVYCAMTLAYFGEDIGAMLALVDRALAFNPSFARGWMTSGLLRLWAGQLDIAIEHVEVAMRLSPRARIGPAFLITGVAHFYSRRFDEALSCLLLAFQEDPSLPQPYRYLAACYAHMGRLDEAREIVAKIRAGADVLLPDLSFLRIPEHRELLLSGLRLATGNCL
jgi:TolB-like protein